MSTFHIDQVGNQQVAVITPTTPQEAVGMSTEEMLKIAVWEQLCGLRNALRTRKAHPTYGITKADLRERLAHLEGVAHALDTVREGYPSASIKLAAQRTMATYDVSLAELGREVDAA